MEAKKRARLAVVGLVLLAIGISAVCVASWNLSADIDRADRTGTSGNIFALGIAPLGFVGFCAVVAGIVTLVVVAARKIRA